MTLSNRVQALERAMPPISVPQFDRPPLAICEQLAAVFARSAERLAGSADPGAAKAAATFAALARRLRQIDNEADAREAGCVLSGVFREMRERKQSGVDNA